MSSHNIHLILALVLCLIFLLSGLMKASGNEKGLAGTRAVNVPDGLGRFTGALEALGALGILIGFKLSLFAWLGFVGLWMVMAGAIFFHFRAKKILWSKVDAVGEVIQRVITYKFLRLRATRALSAVRTGEILEPALLHE